MTTTLVGSNWIVTLILAHFLASIAAAEVRNLRTAVVAITIQSALLASIIASFAYLSHNESLYYWSAITLLSKAVFIPVLLTYYTRRLPHGEVKPLLGFIPSITILSVALVIFYRFIHTYIEFFAPTPEATLEPARSSLSIALAIFALGIYVLVIKRDAIKMVIGLVLLENGVHLSLITLAPTLPETTVIGITTNVVVAAWLLLFLISRIYEVFGTTDTVDLSELKR